MVAFISVYQLTISWARTGRCPGCQMISFRRGRESGEVGGIDVEQPVLETGKAALVPCTLAARKCRSRNA
jgi:hypothetical protein